jgi:hypothetical protein
VGPLPADGGPPKKYAGCKVRGAHVAQRVSEDQIGKMPVYIGVDLAWGKKQASGWTSFFALALTKGVRRTLFNVQSWKGLTGPEVVRHIFDWHERYDPQIVEVESVAAQQYIIDFAREGKIEGLRINGYATKQADKLGVEIGIEQLFTEFEHGLWRIPADERGRSNTEVTAWIDECLAWRPNAHAGDRLMASWFAWKAAYRRIRSLTDAGRKGAKKEGDPDDLARALNTLRPNWRGKVSPNHYQFGKERGGF